MTEPASSRPQLARWADSRLALAAILGAGLLVFQPALRSSFILDDYLHAAMVAGTYPAARGPTGLYDFVSEGDRAILFERGLLPWWTDPALRIRFFRPLSSALRWYEQSLLGEHCLLMHLHSGLWWLLAVLAARHLLRRLLPSRAAFFATAIFALGPWHVLPLAWLANRESLLAVVFGIAGLDTYLRWRDERRAGQALLATGLFSLAAASGEYALCLTGYVVAIELVRREPLVRRALGLLPFALPLAGYLALRVALGYGTSNSSFYLDPLHEPGLFLSNAPGRLLMLLGEGWLTLGNHPWGVSMPALAFVALVLGAAALVALALRRALRALDGPRRASAIWLLTGSLISLFPVLAVVPAPRVLGVSALGMAAAIALVLDHAWFPDAERPQHRATELTALTALALGFAQLVHGPIAAWLESDELRRSSTEGARRGLETGAQIHDLPGAEIALVRGTSGIFDAFTLDRHGLLPARWRTLSHGSHVLVLRKDRRTLELVAAEHHSLYPVGAGNLYRRWTPLGRAGDVVQTPGMRVTLLEVTSEGTRRARFEFDRDLSDTGLFWLEEKREGLQVATMPGPGLGAAFDP